jgi:DNA-binding transcriptional LysR family regulator
LRQTLDLQQLQVFCLVYEHKSLSRAAELTGLQRAAVSKIIHQLESDLGVRLLERTTRKVTATQSGTLLYERGKNLLEESILLWKEVQSTKREPKGKLKITTTYDIGISLTRDFIPTFSRLYPEIQVTFQLSYQFTDLLGEDMDLAIRIGHPGISNLKSVRIGQSPRKLYATQRYLEQRGVPQQPEDLLQHSLLVFQIRQENARWQFRKGEESRELPVDAHFACNSFRMLCDAAVQDMGIVFLPSQFFKEDIIQHELVEVLPEWRMPTGEIFAVYPSREFLPAKVECFLREIRRWSGWLQERTG